MTAKTFKCYVAQVKRPSRSFAGVTTIISFDDGRGSGWPRGSTAGAEGLQDDTHLNGSTDLHGVELRQQPGRRSWQGGPEAVVPSIADTWQDGPFDGEPVDDGLPEDVDAAIKAYGNAVLPQLTELIGRAIMKAANSGESRG